MSTKDDKINEMNKITKDLMGFKESINDGVLSDKEHDALKMADLAWQAEQVLAYPTTGKADNPYYQLWKEAKLSTPPANIPLGGATGANKSGGNLTFSTVSDWSTTESFTVKAGVYSPGSTFKLEWGQGVDKAASNPIKQNEPKTIDDLYADELGRGK